MYVGFRHGTCEVVRREPAKHGRYGPLVVRCDICEREYETTKARIKRRLEQCNPDRFGARWINEEAARAFYPKCLCRPCYD